MDIEGFLIFATFGAVGTLLYYLLSAEPVGTIKPKLYKPKYGDDKYIYQLNELSCRRGLRQVEHQIHGGGHTFSEFGGA